MDENTRQVLWEIRAELEAIIRAATTALEKVATLGAGFGPATPSSSTTGRHRDAREWAIRDLLPGDLLSKLTVVDQGDGVYTVTASWLKRNDWVRVDRKVTSIGGTWIRDGKASRWEIPTP